MVTLASDYPSFQPVNPGRAVTFLSPFTPDLIIFFLLIKNNDSPTHTHTHKKI